MTCYVLTGSCQMTRAALREEIAELYDSDERPVTAEFYRMTARKMRRLGEDVPLPPFSQTFICERGVRRDASVVCSCGHLSERLCDEPSGKGKTCDVPLCRCCATPIGDDLDLCRVHATRQKVST